MKSFKKIALAMVAAMTMGTLVATPASAAPMTLVVQTHNGTVWGAPLTAGTATTSAITRPVPADNSVDNGDVVEFEATVDTGTAVSVVATNAFIVEAVATPTAPVTASSGVSTWSKNVGTGIKVKFYVYTKTTAIGSVAITNQGTTTTYYVQGLKGKINALAISGSDAAAAGTSLTYTVTATDVFGNKVDGKEITFIATGVTISAPAATAGVHKVATGSGLTDFGTADVKFVAPATGSVTLIALVTTATDVETATTGFNTPVSAVSKVVTVRDLAGELAAEKAARAADKVAADAALAAALKSAADAKAAADAAALKSASDLATANAEIAKLKAETVTAKTASDKAIADMKKAFNALAKKWNAKNPKAKVALVK
jgi:hypothetical protein